MIDNRKAAVVLLHSASRAAAAVVRANAGPLTPQQERELFDHVFFGLLVDELDGMQLDALFALLA